MLLAEGLEGREELSGTVWERFKGYGIIGLPFASGHLLALRRMTASSIGPPFTSVWHRNPSGHWTFFVDQEPGWSCPRFFGRSLDRVAVEEIDLNWEGPMELSIRIPEARFSWAARLGSDPRTRILSAAARAVPNPIWRKQWVASTLGGIAGRILGIGELALSGHTPNRQRYVSAPKGLWRVTAAAAMLDGQDLGPIAPLSKQGRLGDFWVPNGGVFALGEAHFESLDPEKHSQATTRWTRESWPLQKKAEIPGPDLEKVEGM